MKKVTRDVLIGLTPVAEGYKVFKHNWTTKHGTSAYGEVEVGSIYTVDGDIKECKWGLHFSKNPLHCFNYYDASGRT